MNWERLTGTCIRFIGRNILGAWPSRTLSVRDDPTRFAFPALYIEVETTALMVDGSTLMPDLLAAMTNSESDAAPLLFRGL